MERTNGRIGGIVRISCDSHIKSDTEDVRQLEPSAFKRAAKRFFMDVKCMNELCVCYLLMYLDTYMIYGLPAVLNVLTAGRNSPDRGGVSAHASTYGVCRWARPGYCGGGGRAALQAGPRQLGRTAVRCRATAVFR